MDEAKPYACDYVSAVACVVLWGFNVGCLTVTRPVLIVLAEVAWDGLPE